jgi:HAMP domain-containing protein
MLVTAIAGVWLLEGTLDNLDYVNREVSGVNEQVNDLVISIRDVRRGLHELSLGHVDQAGAMASSMSKAQQLLEGLGKAGFLQKEPLAAAVVPVRNQMPAFQQMIAGLAANPAVSAAQIDAPMAAANAVDKDATHLAEVVRDQARTAHQNLSDRFRRQLVAISIVFLLTINFAVITLIRAAGMILRPVDSLVSAASELGQEHFDARAKIDDTSGEFGLLAQAFNRMAQQLETSEQKKVEVLGQVALTMNHELNNALGVIELQLTLLSRHADDRRAMQTHLTQIRQSLRQVSGVVDALRKTRRIVLTDYMGGVKMLDLWQSTQQSPQTGEAVPVGHNLA